MNWQENFEKLFQNSQQEADFKTIDDRSILVSYLFYLFKETATSLDYGIIKSNKHNLFCWSDTHFLKLHGNAQEFDISGFINPTYDCQKCKLDNMLKFSNRNKELDVKIKQKDCKSCDAEVRNAFLGDSRILNYESIKLKPQTTLSLEKPEKEFNKLLAQYILSQLSRLKVDAKFCINKKTSLNKPLDDEFDIILFIEDKNIVLHIENKFGKRVSKDHIFKLLKKHMILNFFFSEAKVYSIMFTPFKQEIPQVCSFIKQHPNIKFLEGNLTDNFDIDLGLVTAHIEMLLAEIKSLID